MSSDVWLLIGLIGQGLFFMRFIVQWIASERQKRSVVPIQFWYWSILGSLTLLLYALHRRDPVFILGQSLGSVIYVRNLMLIAKERPEPRP
ncbi:MAG: lipid-A-disaccharide synthase N-terminal domain-containing protein [Nitrospirota bacterium]